MSFDSFWFIQLISQSLSQQYTFHFHKLLETEWLICVEAFQLQERTKHCLYSGQVNEQVDFLYVCTATGMFVF